MRKYWTKSNLYAWAWAMAKAHTRAHAHTLTQTIVQYNITFGTLFNDFAAAPLKLINFPLEIC